MGLFRTVFEINGGFNHMVAVERQYEIVGSGSIRVGSDDLE